MFDKLKKIDASKNKIGLFNTELNVEATAKLTEKMHNQLGGRTTYNNSQQQNCNINLSIINMNIGESIQSALLQGNCNAEKVGALVQDAFLNNDVNKSYVDNQLKNPEILSSLADAQRIAFKTDETTKRKELADLIYSKITTTKSEESNTLSLAIRVMENLTSNHLKAIALLYLFHSGYIKEHINPYNIIDFYNTYLAKLIDFPMELATGIGMTVISSGAAIVYMPSNNIMYYMSENFQNLETLNIDVKNIITKLSDVWKSLATTSVYLTPLGICLGKRYLSTIFDLMVDDSKMCTPVGQEITFVID